MSLVVLDPAPSNDPLIQNAIATAIRTAKKTEPVETDRGVPLAPSAKDLKPWYTERAANPDEEVIDEKRCVRSAQLIEAQL
jgi:hypothetical protein